MLAVLAEAVPHDDEHWAFEMKWDGMRALVVVEVGAVSISSRAGNDATARFPELEGIGAALNGVDAVLDGEIVALDDAGVPSFERLAPRMQAGTAAAVRRLAPEQPVVYMVFDVLWLAGHSTCELPYRERRTLLERLDLSGPFWQTPPTTFGGGAAVLATADQLGLEGVVAKRLDSPYLPGRRADGYHDEVGMLRFAGRVGSGIDATARATLEAQLARLRRATTAFAEVPRLPDPVWVEPEVVVEVAFHQWTSAGVLRAPRYKGLRDDKPASEVVREA